MSAQTEETSPLNQPVSCLGNTRDVSKRGVARLGRAVRPLFVAKSKRRQNENNFDILHSEDTKLLTEVEANSGKSCTGVFVSPQPDQEANNLQRRKILMFIYPFYYHNWRNISTIYTRIYNKSSIKRNILNIKQNTWGSRSG